MYIHISNINKHVYMCMRLYLDFCESRPLIHPYIHLPRHRGAVGVEVGAGGA